MKNKGKKIAIAFLFVAIATAGNNDGAKSADIERYRAMPREQLLRRTDRSSHPLSEEEEYEKRKAFEETLAEKEAAFWRKYNEIKRKSDAIKKEFDQGRGLCATWKRGNSLRKTQRWQDAYCVTGI